MSKDDQAPNFARDRDFADHTRTTLMQVWNQLRTNRQARELRWKEFFYLWTVDPDSEDYGRNYKGRANLNLPQIRKEIETMTRRLVKGLFQDDYLKAEPSRWANQEIATANALIIRHFYDNVMTVKHAFMPWIKQGVTFGTSPIRQYWKKEVNKQYFKKRDFEVSAGGILVQKKPKQVYEEVTLYDAPFIEPCSMFETWVYPETALSPQHIEGIFFRTKVNEEWLEARKAQGLAILPENFEDLGKEVDQEFQRSQETLAAFGTSGTRKALPGQKMYDLLEFWGKLEVTAGGKKLCIPCVVEILNETHVIRIQQNPFWHQQAPFNFMRYITPMPGDFYGRGLPEASISLQNQLNDVLNQMMDSATLSLQPITIINPAFAPNADSFEVEPGAVWWADPDAVKPFTFPDLTGVGIQNATLLRNMITQISDNSPQLPDPIAGKSRSTGQAQLAINEWQTDLFNFIDQIATEALNPMAKQTHALLQQNLPDDAIYRIAGKYASDWVNRVVTPADIVGNLDFKWIGSIQIDNLSVKTQQMLQLLKILPNIPPDAGVRLNWQVYILRLLKDAFNMRDVESLVDTDMMHSSTDPGIENKIIEQNGAVDVEPSDDDKIHIDVHTQGMNASKDPYTRAMFNKHIQEHNEQVAKKQQAAQAQQQQQMMQQQMQQAQLMKAQGKPSGPNNPQGNQGQMSQATDPADLQKGMRG